MTMLVAYETKSTMNFFLKIFNDPQYRYNFVNLYLHVFPGYFAMWYLLNTTQKEILKAWHQKSMIQKEMETILSKLEEAVITKDKENNISFTN